MPNELSEKLAQITTEELKELSKKLSERVVDIIAQELTVQPIQVVAAIELLNEGATVPFISRYRKEKTGGLDDNHLRTLEERLIYLRELNERIETILNSISSQGQLTPELKAKIINVENKTQLEDLYLPYKPKRRTKGQIAIERGLEPLADALLSDATLIPATCAAAYINLEKEVKTVEEALEGARTILMERFALLPEIISEYRELLLQHGILKSEAIKESKQNPTDALKFQDYFEHQEALKNVPSHRLLAMLRGRNEGHLKLTIELLEDKQETPLGIIAKHIAFTNTHTPRDQWLQEVLRWTLRVKLNTHLEVELISLLREQAETEAIQVFAHNLNDLLMAPPAGSRTTLGIDPGFRSGIKVVVLDKTGKVLEFATLYPHQPHNKVKPSAAELLGLCQRHNVDLISIGNGTASRETEKFVQEALDAYPEFKSGPKKITTVITSEAGASVYSASELAAKEFPTLDVTIRGAISIGRRLQDPLAELVKVEPKSIGVGQYQHDVNQTKLGRSLANVIEDCVNAVGVNVNTASGPLLAHIAGLNKTIADNIITYRETNGPFQNREALKKVPRLGAKAFEQAAGFLRIPNGDNPLDSSSVHPEAYPIVKKILDKQQQGLSDIIGNKTILKSLCANDYIDATFGLPTVQDIIKELEKPGRDPRPEFKTAQFKEGIEKISDLKPGMLLEGTVTNVANFGAFVDIGVHQDGLVHISLLSNTFVKDPREVVKTGQIVQVKVIELDIQRKRISLSMRLQDEVVPKENQSTNPTHAKQKTKNMNNANKMNTNNISNSAFADALNKALSK